MKPFGEYIFSITPVLIPLNQQYHKLYAKYQSIRRATPKAGCILLNPSMDKVVLVCSWDGSRWNFPRGKVEDGEDAFECSIREVEEETGFNPRGHISHQHKIDYQQGAKTVTLFIGTNIPENTAFCPKTRKEISKVQFFPLDDLPKNFYNNMEAIVALRKWIRSMRKMGLTPKRSKKAKHERLEAAEFDDRNLINLNNYRKRKRADGAISDIEFKKSKFNHIP